MAATATLLLFNGFAAGAVFSHCHIELEELIILDNSVKYDIDGIWWYGISTYTLETMVPRFETRPLRLRVNRPSSLKVDLLTMSGSV
ncbi:hypothetical protein PT974_07876 [Cladobotryum mycophilum]|uniref:Uncharacterized protein n=1 Tax=Cladobotryum mycophilum TaxID=491253 RepID=A0ABR0SBT1_9HYPO